MALYEPRGSEELDEYLDSLPSTLLSKQQRERLVKDTDNPQSAVNQMHSRIRKRLQYAIYDFILLYDNWDELNLDKAFEEGELSQRFGREGVEKAIATFYRGLHTGKIPFEPLLKSAIWRVEYALHDRSVRVSFTIEPEVWGTTIVNDSARRINPDDVGDLRIDEMRAVLEGLAHSEADIAKLASEGYSNKNQEKRARHEEIREKHLDGNGDEE